MIARLSRSRSSRFLPFLSFYHTLILSIIHSFILSFFLSFYLPTWLLCQFQKYNSKSAEYCTSSQLSSVTAYNTFLQSVSNNNQTFQVRYLTSSFYHNSFFRCLLYHFLYLSVIPFLWGIDIYISIWSFFQQKNLLLYLPFTAAAESHFIMLILS